VEISVGHYQIGYAPSGVSNFPHQHDFGPAIPPRSGMGQSPARVALSWVLGRQGITSTLMGVTRVDWVADNFAALHLTLLQEHRAALDDVSAPDPRMRYRLFTPSMRQLAIFGSSAVTRWTS